jgi:type I restriction enzyme R subunit
MPHLCKPTQSGRIRDFEDVTEGEETEGKEKLKSKWSRLEAMVGTEERLEQVAGDIVTHFDHRLEVMDGKAMIVCMSRRIAVDLYTQIVKLRPDWHSDTDDTGEIKVIMTGSAADPAHFQPHVRNKPRRKALAERFKDPNDPFKVVIVRDMWLTGFDAPSLHTMYIDKPMRGHGLMQAIARVNRVFKDKPGGLVVDYLGIAADLQEAVNDYTVSGSGRPALPQEEAVALMLTQYERVCDLFHGFDYSKFHTGSPTERLSIIPEAMEYVLKPADGKKRFMDISLALSKAFALTIPHEKALDIRDDVAFFQAVRSVFAKSTPSDGKSQAEMDSAIKQLVSEAVTSDEVVNIFAAAGLKKPDISILSDQFLAHLKGMPQRNLAVETLQKLLMDEIKAKSRKNAVKARSFAQMLEETIRRYQNRTVDAAQIITELIDMAKEMREADQRGEELGLTEDELAFYDALADNESAVDVLGNDDLALIARELVGTVRNSVSIDWSVKQGARAKIRVLVKRILRKYGYPPDLQEKATETVLEQAELLANEWVG